MRGRTKTAKGLFPVLLIVSCITLGKREYLDSRCGSEAGVIFGHFTCQERGLFFWEMVGLNVISLKLPTVAMSL